MPCLSGVWTDNYSEQQVYIRDLLSVLRDMDLNTQIVTVNQSNEPSNAEKLAAWTLQTGSVDPPPIGGTIVWFNPDGNVIETLYKTVIDSGTISTGTLYPYTEKDRTTDWEFIDEVVLLEDSATPITISGIPAGYKNLMLFYSLRSADAAATFNFSMRMNGLSGASYFQMRQHFTGAAWSATAGANSTAIANANGVVANNTAQASSSAFGWFLFFSANSAAFRQPVLGRQSTFSGATPFAAASKAHSIIYGAYQGSVAPITQIEVFGATTNFKKGSYVAVYGLK